MPLVKVSINALGEHYMWYEALEPRQCSKGDTIAKGEKYVRFFTADQTTNPPTLVPVAMVCMRHLHRCENCNAPMLNAEDRKFCSEFCRQHYFGQEIVDVEENTFSSEEKRLLSDDR